MFPNQQMWWTPPKMGKPNQEFNIQGTNDLGFSQGFPDKIKAALDKYYQRQLSESTQSANESALASGDFNPEVSKYYATKGAREAQQQGGLQGEQMARQDEYNRFGVMDKINNYLLSKRQVDLAERQYDDSQDFDIGDILGTLSNFIPFFEKGGEVEPRAKRAKTTPPAKVGEPLEIGKDIDFEQLEEEKKKLYKPAELYEGGGEIGLPESRQIINNYEGFIPAFEANAEPEMTGDNTYIKAKTGEVIQSNPAGDLFGRENLKLINQGGQMLDNNKGGLFGNIAAQLANKFKSNTGGSAGAPSAGAQMGSAKDAALGAISKRFATGGIIPEGDDDLQPNETAIDNNLYGMYKDDPEIQDLMNKFYSAPKDEAPNWIRHINGVLIRKNKEKQGASDPMISGGDPMGQEANAMSMGGSPATEATKRKITIEEQPALGK